MSQTVRVEVSLREGGRRDPFQCRLNYKGVQLPDFFLGSSNDFKFKHLR